MALAHRPLPGPNQWLNPYSHEDPARLHLPRVSPSALVCPPVAEHATQLRVVHQLRLYPWPINLIAWTSSSHQGWTNSS